MRPTILALLLAMLAAPAVQAQTQTSSRTEAAGRTHRVVVQVTQDDPALMNTALNNIENMTRYFEGKKERIEVELVAYGPGLHMLRSDTSPVKDRLSAVAGRKNVTLTGCGNTLAAQAKQDGRQLSLVPEARIVPAGIVRIVELQESGWTYVRP